MLKYDTLLLERKQTQAREHDALDTVVNVFQLVKQHVMPPH